MFASERTLEICVEGLRSESEAGSQIVRWWFVESLNETESHVGIVLALGSSFVVPKSSVDPQILKVFLSDLRERIQKPANPT